VQTSKENRLGGLSKSADRLPVYRQNGIFEQEGVDMPRATQTSWVLWAYDATRSLEDELKRAVPESDVSFSGVQKNLEPVAPDKIGFQISSNPM
jgi:hypothetical protein